ncbi:potassium channel protein [Candidatus Poribacteria bacterium]|nr:potassium channel protein [Candidatus Poribacteria bacterium]MYG05469.1 potassium channel protein [Candidatus Poribacteria bacterium]MYK23040.1 potassium channel protein [Candidatus Poribacteria bacterium]
MNYQRKIIIALVMLAGLLVTGTIGYLMLESGWDPLDAVYMTVITLTTAGHDDLEMSDRGRIFTILLLLGGIGVFTYSVTVATTVLIEGQLQNFFRQQRMTRTVDKLSNHYIICGLGDTGVHVLDEMLKAEVDFVGIESEEERLIHLTDTRNFPYLHGDATDDELLVRAGIANASGLVTCLSRDQDNLFVVISARKLNPHLRIASKAVEDNSPGKLITAGADEVVLPDHIGGLRLASGILQPQLVGFLENITQNRDGAQFTESVIQKDSPLDGISLKAASIREQTGLVVIAIRDNDRTFLYNPPGDKKMVAGEALLVIANQKQLQILHKLTGDLS